MIDQTAKSIDKFDTELTLARKELEPTETVISKWMSEFYAMSKDQHDKDWQGFLGNYVAKKRQEYTKQKQREFFSDDAR